ncbi:PhzF family phenazine biosynthesis protein [Nonomuraea typhae]|uniref:PhzF family phenazine biosynthesis protein n=1 Tax=Nonomuraea typhae TaxID=2603600 RepID=UPI0012F8E18F|nr:PhzF family phenazine biosynthesis protein [Nonomuraea typhae]
MTRPYCEVDVFSGDPFSGNPVAVVLDADDLSDETMQRFAAWTNLSETTFVSAPSSSRADYRVRIFTPTEELPFAGHPTLGSCHAWQRHTGAPPREVTYQECAAGLIPIRRTDSGLAFAAPPVRAVELDEALLGRAAESLGLDRAAVVAAHHGDNGPRWLVLLLATAAEVLALRPRSIDLQIGVVGPYPAGSPEAFEVRAFVPTGGGVGEDPVTGSLNAIAGRWLFDTGRVAGPYVVSQGTAVGRRGRVHVADSGGALWVGGGVITCVTGSVEIGPG